MLQSLILKGLPLTLSCIMLKNDQPYFKTLRCLFTLQHFWSMFDHFSTLYVKELNHFVPIYHMSRQMQQCNKYSRILEYFKINGYIGKIRVNPLSANPTKWSKTLKHFVSNCRRIAWVCLTIFWGWCLKG